MKKRLVRLVSLLALAGVVAVGFAALSSPVSADRCGPKPRICPAIGVVCLPGPNGEPRKACRLNPCSCKYTCVPLSHRCGI